MLVREGEHRNDEMDRRLASLLAAVAGGLNAAAFYAVGFFSANMTGNVSALSDHFAFAQWSAGLFYFAIVLTFIGGSALSTLLINAGRRRRMHRVYAYIILAEGLLLGILGCADLWLLDAWRAAVMVLGLAFLMGLQNAVVTRISGARVRTTHVSGTATDIGIELAMAFDIMRGREPRTERGRNWNKLRLHVYTIMSFLIGGIVGVVAYRNFGGWLLVVAGVMLFVTALATISQARNFQAPAGA